MESQVPHSLLFGHLTGLGRHICDLVQRPKPTERAEPLLPLDEFEQPPEASLNPVYVAEVRPAAIQSE